MFAGRRWEIVGIDEKAKVLTVASHRGGRIPKFEGANAEETHDEVLFEMRRVYEFEDVPAYLDGSAKTLLAHGRSAYRRAGLSNTNAVDTGLACSCSRGSDQPPRPSWPWPLR